MTLPAARYQVQYDRDSRRHSVIDLHRVDPEWRPEYLNPSESGLDKCRRRAELLNAQWERS